MAEETRLAGTLVGAVLESTGYHYQQAILEAFQAPFENEIGGLIYLIAIVMAIIFTATQGGFRMSAWLLIGPPLFFSVIQVTDQIPNARWEFGNQARDQRQKESAINRATGEAEQTATVSKVFAKYVRMVSSANQAIVNRLTENRENTDKWFMIKAQLFANLHTAQIQDAGLLELFHKSIVIDCAEAIYWAEMYNDPLFRPDTPNDPAAAAVAGATEGARSHFQPSKADAEKGYKEAIKKKVGLRGPAVQYLESRIQGLKLSDEAVDTTSPDGVKTREVPVSCGQLWYYVMQVIYIDSEQYREQLLRNSENNGIPREVLTNVLLQVSGVAKEGSALVFSAQNDGQGVTPQDAEILRNIIALYFLRNEANNPDRGAWIRFMAGRHEARTIGTQLRNQNGITERSRVSVLEWANKERLIHTAASLPYYQGLILYFLGALFPFFALLLLVPGKHGGFMLWFLLWMWAKSWDIFFAFVMLLDDTLFGLFAVQKQEISSLRLLPPEVGEEIGLAFASIRQLDPSFQLSTYYSLIAVTMVAVPMASAQMFLGAMAGGASLIERGSKMFSDAFADSAHHFSIRDAQFNLQNDASALLKTEAQGRSRLAGLQSQVAAARSQALSSGAMTEKQIAQLGVSNQEYSSQTTPYTPEVGPGQRDAANKAAGAGGFNDGLSSGSSVRPFGGPNEKNSERMFRAWSLMNDVKTRPDGKYDYRGAIIDKAQADAITAVGNAELAYESQRLEWLSMREEIRGFHAKAAPLGILPLPPSGFYGEPSQQELNIAYTKFQEEFNYEIAKLETSEQVSKKLIEAAQTIRKNIKDLKDVSNMTPAEKKELATKVRTIDFAVSALQIAPTAYNSGTTIERVKKHVDDAQLDMIPGFILDPEGHHFGPGLVDEGPENYDRNSLGSLGDQAPSSRYRNGRPRTRPVVGNGGNENSDQRPRILINGVDSGE